MDIEVHDLVADHISTDWKKLGRFLLVDDNTLDAIDYEYQQLYEKAYQMLLRWYQSQQQEFYLEKLNRALKEINRSDIVSQINKSKQAQS